MWSRRAQEYEAKINSGSLVQIAEVVRDLYKKEDQGEQSYSERQMYQAALERLAGEFAAVEDVDKTSAATKLEKIMTANPRVGKEDDEVLSWLRTMSNERFRHVPVVDSSGKLINIMSQGDFVSYTWPDLLYQASQMTKATLSKHFNLTSILVMIMIYSMMMKKKI